MQKKGISLIVLVITIIVMIILAATVVITLSNTGIIDRADYAVQVTDKKQVENLAALTWAELYTEGIKEEFVLETKVNGKLEESGVDTNKYNINVRTTGIEIKENIVKLNEYGFYNDIRYVNTEYMDPNYNQTSNVEVVLKVTGDIIIYSSVDENEFQEGENVSFGDFMGYRFATAENLQYNVVYNGEGTLNSNCSCFVSEEKIEYYKYIINKENITYSNKEIDLGGMIKITFSEDGKSFVFNGQTFVVAE